MTDDSLQRATFDVDLNLNRQSEGSASAWVHMALTVTKTSLKTYINGVAVPNDKIGYAQGESWWSWATHKDNMALGDPAELRGQLSSITLEGCAYLGSGHPKYSWAAGQGYSGSFAGVQLLKGAMAEADAMCLYQVAEGQSKSCPTFSSLFGDGLGRPWQNGALANGNVGPDLAYVQTPHQMVRRTMIAGIWVAFFRECQQYRAGRSRTSSWTAPHAARTPPPLPPGFGQIFGEPWANLGRSLCCKSWVRFVESLSGLCCGQDGRALRHPHPRAGDPRQCRRRLR